MNGLSSKGEWSENLEKKSAAIPLEISIFNFTPSKIDKNFIII